MFGWLQKIWTRSIRRQLMLGIALVHALLMTIFVVDLVSRQRHFLHEQSIGTTISLAQSLSSNSVSWILANDVIGLEEVIQSQSRFPDLLYAMILSPDGKVLGHSDRSKVGLYIEDPTSCRLINARPAIQRLVTTNKNIDIAAPVFANDQLIGWARVGISQEKNNAGLRVITQDGILYTIFAIAVGSIFALLMAQGLTRGMQHLVQVAESIGKGNEDERVSVNRHDELGQLGKALNSMLNTIIYQKKETKKAQQALEEREAQLHTLIETLPDLVWLKNPDGVYITCNHKFERFFGAKESEIAGKTDYDFVDKELADFFRENDKAALFANGPRINEEEIRYADDGHHETLETIKTPMYDANGALIGVLGVGRDITDRKEQETLIRTSKEEWERTFNAIPDIVSLLDPDFHILKINKAGCDTFRRGYDEIIGLNCHQLFRGVDEPCSGCPNLRAIASCEPATKEMVHEPLGKTFLVSAAPLWNEAGELTHIVHVAKDISEIKKMEEQLFQAQKMEAIGTLAGGIAHDFNNILSVIMGHAELAKLSIAPGSEAGESIDHIFQASKRACELIQHILAFSRKSDHSLQPLAPHVIIKEALKMLRASIPSTITIVEEIDAKCGKIMGDPIHIHQIIVNLCTNALQAMEKEKGTLSIKLYRRKIAQEEINHESGVAPGSFIVLEVRDSGRGMDPATIERIFEPYFTTKEVGKGTGLGLAVIHGIIQEYHGFIRVRSKPGEGSVFHIHIPALVEAPCEHSSVERLEEAPSAGDEHILVLDDEKMIADLHRVMLEQLGYRVTTMNTSLDALEAVRAHPERFDLIITDQTMPQLSGADLAQEVLKIVPEMPIILCTGYSSVLSEEEALALGIKRYLIKPLQRVTLTKTVRELLDARHHA